MNAAEPRRVALAAVMLIAAGCGYHLGAPGPAGVERLAVPTFANDTEPLRRDLEHQLTRVVHEELRRRGHPALVAEGDESADAVLAGRLVEVTEQALLEGADDRPRSLRVSVTVQVVLRARDGRVLLERTLHETGDTDLVGAGRRSDAFDRAFRQVARSLAHALSETRE